MTMKSRLKPIHGAFSLPKNLPDAPIMLFNKIIQLSPPRV
jgi:hypothetical protein